MAPTLPTPRLIEEGFLREALGFDNPAPTSHTVTSIRSDPIGSGNLAWRKPRCLEDEQSFSMCGFQLNPKQKLRRIEKAA
jgi:hypothetical protein